MEACLVFWNSVKGAPAKRTILALAAVFIFSHIVYFSQGVRFDDRPPQMFWQFLDPELLKNKLFESVFYLHIQPPLYNFFLGLVFKLFAGNEKLIFQCVYTGLGALLCCSMFLLQVRLGVSFLIAFVLTSLFVLSPAFMLYEHWLYYTLPVALLLSASSLCLLKALNSKRQWPLHLFFLLLFLLGGIRSMFHISHYIFVVVLLTLIWPEQRKRILACSVVPFLLLFSIYLKNFIVFGQFSTSSWMGMNSWSVTGQNMELSQRQNLFSQEKISDVALVDKFSLLEAYPKRYLRVKGYENVAALQQITKSTGYNNYNHIAYLAISAQYFKDNLYILTHHPKVVLFGISRALLLYCRSSSESPWLWDNWKKVSIMNNLYGRFLLGQVDLSKFGPLRQFAKEPHFVCLTVVFGYPFLFLWALRMALGKPAGTITALEHTHRVVILYLCFNIFYVALVGNLFELGENNRIRFGTDPLCLVLLGIFIQNLWKQRQSFLRFFDFLFEVSQFLKTNRR